MANTLKFGNGEWYGKKDTILAYNDENDNYKPLPFDFSRNSSATVINKDGLIETVGSGQPRIDYKDDAKGALLLEPQRSNLVTYSEDFSQSFWAKQASVTLDKGYLAPDGTYNATKISGVIGSSYVVSQSGILSSSSTKSIWAKTISGTGVIHLGANQSQSNASFTITNEWQRFEVTGTTTDVYAVDFRNASTTLSEILVWGAQGENGSYATSYIPTFGSAVTRVAESSSQTPPDGVIGQTEGTLLFNFSKNTPNVTALFGGLYSANWGTGILIRTESGNIRVDVLSSYSGLYTYFSTININNSKLAVKWDSGVIKIFINGNLRATSGVITIPTLSSLSLSSRGGGVTEHTITYKYAKIYNTALTDQELIELTTIQE